MTRRSYTLKGLPVSNYIDSDTLNSKPKSTREMGQEKPMGEAQMPPMLKDFKEEIMWVFKILTISENTQLIAVQQFKV